MTTIDAERFDNPPTEPKKKRDKTHWLYIAVIIAVIAGVIVGLVWKDFGVSLAVLGTLFVSLIKMMISPVIFCTIVLGIGSVRAAASVGRVGGLALAYFLSMSTIALGIGMVVGNLIQPGDGLDIPPSGGADELVKTAEAAGGTMDFIAGIIPTSLLSSLTAGSVLQTLFVAILVGFALQAMGKSGEGILKGIGAVQKLVFRILTMILWLAPIGAFGAIAGVVGKTGFDAVLQLGTLMLAFYVTCFIFVFFFLGLILKFVSGFSIFKLVKYLAREYLLIVATSSSESALPRLIAKMEPRRHRDLPDDGLDLHRRRHEPAALDPRAVLAAAVHDHRLQGCSRSLRSRTGHAGRGPGKSCASAAGRRPDHRRNRPLHVRSPRRHQLLG
jgi:aerobic C4-dicarboxylate transport protein